MEQEDKRGYDLRVDHFSKQLLGLINNSNLNISTVYYIIKDMCNTLERGFETSAHQQYLQFCEETNKEKETDKKDEAE